MLRRVEDEIADPNRRPPTDHPSRRQRAERACSMPSCDQSRDVNVNVRRGVRGRSAGHAECGGSVEDGDVSEKVPRTPRQRTVRRMDGRSKASACGAKSSSGLTRVPCGTVRCVQLSH